MKNATAVLLAGGKSTRFDPENIKTLFKIEGKTLTEHVIEDIEKANIFNDIILVYNEKYETTFKKICKKYNIKYAKNGATRFLSAYNGLLKSKNNKIIFIDVAAPFYQKKMLEKMIKKLDKYAGIMTTVLDMRADHVLVNGDKVEKIFKRGKILRVKSYQGVNKDEWLKSFKNTPPQKSKEYTEMLKVMIDNNLNIGNVISENNPRKITTKEDLVFFENKDWSLKK